MSNKLGLTDEERAVFYTNALNERRVGEVRQYDPINGFLILRDPMLNKQIEFLWDSSSSKWIGLGLEIGYIAEVSYDTPITKQDDSSVPAKATTVSRFPEQIMYVGENLPDKVYIMEVLNKGGGLDIMRKRISSTDFKRRTQRRRVQYMSKNKLDRIKES